MASTTHQRLVVIGASTGGPAVLEKIVCGLREPFYGAILIVQHMAASFTESMAKRLNAITSFPILEVCDGERVEAGTVFIAPGNSHTIMEKKLSGSFVFKLEPATGTELAPSIDRAMLSAVELYGSHLCGVICTGMGNDGSAGMAAIEKNGGVIMVQDPSTCVVSSMPEAVDKACKNVRVCSPDSIADALRLPLPSFVHG